MSKQIKSSDRHPRSHRRTPKGAEPGHIVVSKGMPSVNSDALREAVASSEDGFLSKQARLRLKAELASKARSNVADLELEFYEDMDAANKRLEQDLKMLMPELEKQRKVTGDLNIKYVESCAMIPIQPKDDGSATWGEDEPFSLEEIAAEHGLPVPQVVPDPKDQRWLMNYGSAASAAMLSLGLHVIRGEEMDQIVQQPIPFVMIGALCFGITRMLCAGCDRIGIGGGDHVARASIESKRTKTGVMWIAFIAPLPVSFCTGVGIEAMVDGFGIYKTLSESSNLNATIHPSPLVTGTLSLLVSYPLFLYYMVKSFHYGYYRTFMARLKLLQTKLRKEVKAELWKALEAASAVLKPNLKKLGELENEAEDIKSKIRYELNEEEINRLLDLGEKAYSCDMEFRQEAGYDEHATKARSVRTAQARSPA